MNILLTSVGRRSYLVKYFKEVLGTNGEVHVSNSSDSTPTFMYADKSVVSPMIYDKEYIPFLIKYCIENEINAIISLFDIDLPILAANKHEFEKIGVKLVLSDESIINICNDKYETYRYLLNKGYNVPKTYVNLVEVLSEIEQEVLNFPLIVKPRWGMGSIGVFQADNLDELKVFYNKVLTEIKKSYLKFESNENFDKSVIIQEKLKGQEYGLDIINNLDSIYQNTIVKKKMAMRSGETDCAEVVDCKVLKELGQSLSNNIKHVSNLDVDIFFDDKNAYILEINARFGGGYPFSHIAGVNLPLAIIKWLKNEEVKPEILNETFGILGYKDIEIVKQDNSKIDRVTEKFELVKIINQFDKLFNPSLSSRNVDIEKFSLKLLEKALIIKLFDKDLIGFAALYANDKETKNAYLTLIAIKLDRQGKEYGKKLLTECYKIAQSEGMKYIKLEVQNENKVAIEFYVKQGFKFIGDKGDSSKYMIKEL